MVNIDHINLVLEKVKKRDKGQISDSERAIFEWSKNIDKGYAFIILFALFFAMCTTLGPYRIYSLIFARVTSDGVYTREEASWPVSTIYTVENLVGPLVSIIACHISYRQTYLIGSVLLMIGNGFTALSSSVWIDTLLIGLVQGVGFSFMCMPLMEIVNSYFIRYRSLALGLSLSGGTLSIFILSPIFQWLLETYPWRYSYLGIVLICSMNLITIPLLKPNPMPQLQPFNNLQLRTSVDKLSVLELRYHNVCKPDQQNSKFSTSVISSLLKTPAFHLIWFNQLLYFWLFTVWCLVMVDYGLDRGCTLKEAESLLSFQSVGELVGRLVLTAFIDRKFLTNRISNILTLLFLAGLLVSVTFVQGYVWLAVITVSFTAFVSLLYIQLNGLLIDYLGQERVTIGFGMSSFISGILIILRPQALGYFRDQHGTYDPLLGCLAIACSVGALLWLLEPLMTRALENLSDNQRATKDRADDGSIA